MRWLRSDRQSAASATKSSTLGKCRRTARHNTSHRKLSVFRTVFPEMQHLRCIMLFFSVIARNVQAPQVATPCPLAKLLCYTAVLVCKMQQLNASHHVPDLGFIPAEVETGRTGLRFYGLKVTKTQHKSAGGPLRLGCTGASQTGQPLSGLAVGDDITTNAHGSCQQCSSIAARNPVGKANKYEQTTSSKNYL